MTCPDIGLWRAWLDGETDRARALAEHLTTCAHCSECVEALRCDASLAGSALGRLAPATLPEAATVRRARAQLAAAVAPPVRPAAHPVTILEDRPIVTTAFTATRWRVAMAGLAAALALSFALATPAGQGAAAQFLAQFRSQRFTAVPVDPTRIPNPYSELERLGTVRGDRPLSRGQDVSSLAEASQRVGFDVKQPARAALPAGLDRAPTIRVVPASEQRFTFERAKARAYLEGGGHRNVDLPARFDGATLVTRVPAAAMLEYRAADGSRGFVVGQAGQLEVGVEGSVSLEEFRDFLLSLPNIPPETANQLRSIKDWRNTLPIPVPADQVRWQETNIAGSPGLLLSGASGLGNAAIWQRDGRVYGVVGTISQDELRRVADSLR